MYDQYKVDPVTPCMDVYKAKMQSDVILYRLKLVILVRGDVQNKEIIGYTWSPISLIRNLKCFLEDVAKNK